MTRWAALLRGVNVGGHRKVPMKRLAGIVAGLGHTDVTTYLQSGNVVFGSDTRDPAALAADLETALAAELGFEVAVLLRSHAELDRVVARNPFPAVAADPTKLVVVFLAEPVNAADVPPVPEGAVEEVRADRNHLYVHHPNGQGRSKLDDRWWRQFPPVLQTVRNWRTVTALRDLTA